MEHGQLSDVRLQFRGTRLQLKELVDLLNAELGRDSVRPGEPVPIDDDTLGQVELVDVVVHFFVAVAAHISASEVHGIVRKYVRSQPSAQLVVESEKKNENEAVTSVASGKEAIQPSVPLTTNHQHEEKRDE